MSTSAPIPTAGPESCTGHAPGKIILSGEHAVVHGAPALAVAIARYTEVSFTPLHRGTGLRTAFANLNSGQLYPLELLRGFKQGLDRRFDSFLRGDLPVQHILQRPDDLVVYSLASLLQHLPVPGVSAKHHLPAPGQLSSHSDLPLGAGMGSSASAIAATFVLYEHLLCHPLTPEERFERVRFCERLQHGKGSAIDAASVVHGGLNRIENGQPAHVALPDGHGLRAGRGWYWVLHGIPASSTGECVAEVRARHGHDTVLWDAFATVTNALQAALETDTDPDPMLNENHRLLCHIGVVPAAAQRFVDAVTQAGGAAKICGAGSIRGEHGGVILVHLDDPEAMARLMQTYPERQWEPLEIAAEGAALGPPPGAPDHPTETPT